MISFWSTLAVGRRSRLSALGMVLSLRRVDRRGGVESVFADPWLALVGVRRPPAAPSSRAVWRARSQCATRATSVFLLGLGSDRQFTCWRLSGCRLEVMAIVILPLRRRSHAGHAARSRGQSRYRIASARWRAHCTSSRPVLGVRALLPDIWRQPAYLVQEQALKGAVRSLLPRPLERCEGSRTCSLSLDSSLLSFVIVTGAAAAMLGAPASRDRSCARKSALAAWLMFAMVMYNQVFFRGWRRPEGASSPCLGFLRMILRMLEA